VNNVRVEKDGYAIETQVFGKTEIAQLIAQIGSAGLPRSRAGIRHAMKHPVVAAFARDSRLLQLAQQVLGPAAFPFRATLFDKSSTANWLVVWHQDTALPLRERRETPGWGPWSVKDGVIYAHAPASALEEVLALRVHLDDSTLQNGPLRVLPSTHTIGVLSDGELQKLSKRATAVDCLVPRGGVLAMRPLIVHASSKSQSEAPRRVLHIEYAASLSLGDGLQLAAA
jgi:ectoine hydroxylase-related dioxygenase (phytanoyl-CoA dioxygenase family)